MANTYVDYTASASQTDFAFSFPYLEDTHVVVEIDGIDKTITTDFTIPSVGLVRLNSGATAGQLVRVKRISDFATDLVNFVNGSVLNEADLDRAYQHNRYLNEEAAEGNSASMQLVGGGTDYNAKNKKIVNLADPTADKDAVNKSYIDERIALSGTTLNGFNKSTHTGDNTETEFTLSFTSQIATPEAYRVTIDGVVQTPTTAYSINTATNKIVFTSAPPTSSEIVVVAMGTASSANDAAIIATGSTTSRSLADRFSDVINVKDYGAKGNGTDDDTDAIQAAINDANGSVVYFPNGTYAISTTLVVPSNTSLVGETRENTILSGVYYNQRFILKNNEPTETTLTQTSNVDSGDNSISITNSMSSGDFMRIKSTQRFTRNWDGGSVIRASYVDGELMKIKEADASSATFTENIFLDFPLSVADTITTFTPLKNINIKNLSFVVPEDANLYSNTLIKTKGIEFSGVDGFVIDNVYFENTEVAGIGLYRCMNGSITNVFTKGGNPTQGLNYGIVVNDGTKHVSIKNVYGDSNRHAVAGGGTGYAIPMYIDVDNVSCANAQSHVMDTHGNCANWNVTNIVGNVSCSGIGIKVSNVTSSGGTMYMSYEGGYGCSFTNFYCTALTSIYKNKALNNCSFTNIRLGFKSPNYTNSFGTGNGNSFKNIELINESYEETMTETQADATIAGVNGYIGFVIYNNYTVDGLLIRGFPVALLGSGGYSKVQNVRIEESGWATSFTTEDCVIRLNGTFTRSTLDSVTVRMDNTVINNNTRILWLASGDSNLNYSTLSNIVTESDNPYYYGWLIQSGIDYVTFFNISLDGTYNSVSTGANNRIWKVTAMADN